MANLVLAYRGLLLVCYNLRTTVVVSYIMHDTDGCVATCIWDMNQHSYSNETWLIVTNIAVCIKKGNSKNISAQKGTRVDILANQHCWPRNKIICRFQFENDLGSSRHASSIVAVTLSGVVTGYICMKCISLCAIRSSGKVQ